MADDERYLWAAYDRQGVRKAMGLCNTAEGALARAKEHAEAFGKDEGWTGKVFRLVDLEEAAKHRDKG